MSSALLFALILSLNNLPGLLFRLIPFTNIITPNQRKKLIRVYLSIFCVGIILYCWVFFRNNFALNEREYTFLKYFLGTTYTLVTWWIIKGYLFQHLFIVGMQSCFTLLIHSVVTTGLQFFGIHTNQLRGYLIDNALYSVFSLILIFLFWKYLRKAFLLTIQTPNDSKWKIISLVPMLLYAIGLLSFIGPLTNTGQQFFIHTVVGITVFIIWVTVNFEMANMEEKRKLEMSNRILNLQMESINQQAKSMQASDDKIRILRHDMRHQVQMLHSLVVTGYTDKAAEILSQMNEDLISGSPIFYSANPVINAALMVYINIAREQGIPINANIDIPEEIPWNSNDLAILFSNTLENAIHASQAQPIDKRKIVVSARYDDQKMAILVKNRFDGDVLFRPDGLPLTTKAGHGIGMDSIASIVAKYNGFVSCSCEDGWFTIQCLFSASLLPASPPTQVSPSPARE